MSTLLVLIVLSILILVHEWGHFVVAKKVGIKVEVFSIGFGPKLFSWVRGGTEFRLSAIPLGGYVKPAGEDRAQCTGAPGEFYSHPAGHRALVVATGPAVNMFFAYACMVLVFLIGFPGLSTTVREVIKGGPADRAGLEVSDKIIAVNDRKIYGQHHLERLLRGPDPGPLTVTVLRGGASLTLSLTPQVKPAPDDLGASRLTRDLGVGFILNKIGAVEKGFPADKAGLREGDIITAINGRDIHNWTGVQENIAHSTADKIVLNITREGQGREATVAPKVIAVTAPGGGKEERRVIGIAPGVEIDAYRFGFIPALGHAGEEIVDIVALTFKGLYRVVTGVVPAKEAIGGPIRIFSAIQGAAATGVASLLWVVAVISTSLAIFNFFPIPVLDGGHLAFLLVEKFRGRPLSLKIEEALTRAGFTVLMLLMAFVLYNDAVEMGWVDKIFTLLRHRG